MGYDMETMTPTYRLSLGRPGPSLGLEVAARLGLPGAILDRAKALLSPQAAALAGAIGALDREREALAGLKGRLSALEAAAREATLRQDAAAASLEREREAFAAAKATRLAAEIRRAKTELEAILDAARRESEPRKIRALRPRLDAVITPGAPAAGDADTVPARDYEIGTRVRVVSLGTEGVLLDETRGRKRVRVRVGDREVSVSPAQLRPGRGATDPVQAPDARLTPPDQAPETIEVIGTRAADALERIDQALDRAAAAGNTRLRVLHGHGTGRLKTAVRTHLAASPYVASQRPGEDLEGGDAVTIVTLK
jgi:DNA mismatch repair protein MutS2